MSYQLKEVAERIRTLREIAGLSEKEMALLTNVTEKEYLELEKGEVDFNFNFIYKCADVFKVEMKDILKVLWKEFLVSFFCGIALAVVNFGKMMLVDQGAIIASGQNPILVALVVSLTLLATVVCAKLVGCSLPILVKRLGFDPAVTASPFVTTIVDAISLLIYFVIAMQVLHI